MMHFTKFLDRVKGPFPVMINKFISFILGQPKHLGKFKILESESFKANFSLENYLKDKFEEVMKEASENLWEFDDLVDFLIDILDTEQLLKFRAGKDLN